MTDLNEIWARIEAHQPSADRRGFGLEWRVMCEERTNIAAEAAVRAAVKAARYAKTFAAVKAALAAADVAHTAGELANLERQTIECATNAEGK